MNEINLKESAKRYVKAKIQMTKCMQEHFRQLCSRCPLFTQCTIYRDYCNAWMVLQEAVEDE